MDEVAGEITPPVPARRLARRLLFTLLVFLSALIGALTGLVLVYSTDLPEIEVP